MPAPSPGLTLQRKVAACGCPYKCDFCSLTVNPLGQKRDYVSRSPESVADEIASSPADIILFADDIFFLEPRKAERLCDLLIERGIQKRYVVQCRLEVFKFPRMLEKAYRAGFRMMLIGVESATDRILAQLHKGFTTDEARKAFAKSREHPFWYHAYFIYGLMGQPEEEMLAIPDFARKLGVQSIGLSLLRVDEFTPLRKEVEQSDDYWISTNGYVYSKEYGKKRLRRIRNTIRNRFQYHPAQMAKAIGALWRSGLVKPSQMLRLWLISPLFLVDYGLHRGRKLLRRLRRKPTPAGDAVAGPRPRTSKAPAVEAAPAACAPLQCVDRSASTKTDGAASAQGGARQSDENKLSLPVIEARR